jgi:hypothetical protein
VRYSYLLSILDCIVAEAPQRYSAKYPKGELTEDQRNQARARALIHLFLKVKFGLVGFEERERFITDGSYDAGIDGYYIDQTTRTIYLIQSKFRTTASNYESKEISLGELFAMDITRVTEGHEADDVGNAYSGKILQLQREIKNLPDIARYSYQVILLANLKSPPFEKLKLLYGGYQTGVIDSEVTYKELVFPVISGTYFTASDIVIPIDLSTKNAGSKISYEVRTKYADCQITVLFVPAIEIAKLMQKYKNAILKYNPRSYLELDGQAVNRAIRDTVIAKETNELALYNNGITMLSEDTSINERVGQRGKAQLYVRNPQIINGGQTSFTLSRILSEHQERAEQIFGDKEIMLKVITVPECPDEKRALLIDEISAATNRQTPVINADRFANESFHKQLQELIFQRYGLLYEKKRGEFSDGVHDRYVLASNIVERNNFWRIYYASNGSLHIAVQKKLFQRNLFPADALENLTALDRWRTGFAAYKCVVRKTDNRIALGKGHYAKIYACVELFADQGTVTGDQFDDALEGQQGFWSQFIAGIKQAVEADPRGVGNGLTGKNGCFSASRYYKSHRFLRDIQRAVQNQKAASVH